MTFKPIFNITINPEINLIKDDLLFILYKLLIK